MIVRSEDGLVVRMKVGSVDGSEEGSIDKGLDDVELADGRLVGLWDGLSDGKIVGLVDGVIEGLTVQSRRQNRWFRRRVYR